VGTLEPGKIRCIGSGGPDPRQGGKRIPKSRNPAHPRFKIPQDDQRFVGRKNSCLRERTDWKEIGQIEQTKSPCCQKKNQDRRQKKTAQTPRKISYKKL
jgi:hypothetical protein